MATRTDKLAIDGGAPVRTQPLPYGRQWLDDDDVDAVVAVLRSDWLTTGPRASPSSRRRSRRPSARRTRSR